MSRGLLRRSAGRRRLGWGLSRWTVGGTWANPGTPRLAEAGLEDSLPARLEIRISWTWISASG